MEDTDDLDTSKSGTRAEAESGPTSEETKEKLKKELTKLAKSNEPHIEKRGKSTLKNKI